jgi:lysophosphatidate acyltransferase
MVDRKNSKDAVKMMHQVGEDMKRKGVSLWIFPEGTRSLNKENDMLPFKKGAFHLAVQGEQSHYHAE